MKSVKLTVLMLILGFTLSGTAGCGQQESEEVTPIALVLLVGSHANSAHFDVSLSADIEEAYSSFGNACIIVADGHPALLADESETGILGCYDIDYITNSKNVYTKNETPWKRDFLQPQTDKFLEALDACTADDPETDLLEAFHAAEKALNTLEISMGTAVRKEIIILDTGLSTSGCVNFLAREYLELLNSSQLSEGGTDSCAMLSDMLDNLERQAELPNLNGVHVTWYGLGQVSEPQEQLSKLAVQNLQCIWGELLIRAGALSSDKASSDEKYGMFLQTSSHGSIESTQYVTPVQWNLDDDAKDSEDTVDADSHTAESPLPPELTEKQIFFYPNSAEPLLSEKELESSLEVYISHFQSYPDDRVLLVGATSSWNDGSISLSAERAQKIKHILVKASVPENCIDIIGIGYDPDFCMDDSPNGTFEESIAWENRCVAILSYTSSKAQDVLARARTRSG